MRIKKKHKNKIFKKIYRRNHFLLENLKIIIIKKKFKNRIQKKAKKTSIKVVVSCKFVTFPSFAINLVIYASVNVITSLK